MVRVCTETVGEDVQDEELVSSMDFNQIIFRIHMRRQILTTNSTKCLLVDGNFFIAATHIPPSSEPQTLSNYTYS